MASGSIDEGITRACGTGVCLGCAVPLIGGGYDRACKEGPVYAAAAVDWAALPSHLPYAVTP